MTLRLGCIADDLTGATDLANTLVRAGMRVVQTIGVPDAGGVDRGAPVDALVIALKSRTVPAADAVAQALAACRHLRAAGATQIYFKVCSTFDSTPAGNIGPVLEALMDELACRFALVTPAFPDNGRTVFKGHLFVGDVLLSDSGMRRHPLTPMTDANLLRVLSAQLSTSASASGALRRVGLIGHGDTGASAGAIVARCEALQAEGVSIAIADAIDNADLLRLGTAAARLPLLCGGSGLALGLAANFGIAASASAASLPTVRGFAAVVSGSCSEATQAQVDHFVRAGGAAWRIDPLVLRPGQEDAAVEDIGRWAEQRWAEAPSRPVLVYSTARPEQVAAAQAGEGVAQVGARIERLLAGIAATFVECGARRLVIAGGETAGECVRVMGIRQLRIGAQIEPGVPWCYAETTAAPSGLHVALKSGNFGAADFFTRAFDSPVA